MWFLKSTQRKGSETISASCSYSNSGSKTPYHIVVSYPCTFNPVRVPRKSNSNPRAYGSGGLMVSVLDCASRDLGTRPSPVNVVYMCSREKHSTLSHSVSPPGNIIGYQRIVREAWWRRDGLAGGGGGVYSQSLPATVWSRNNLRLGRPLGWNEDLTLLQERVIIILYTKVTLQIEFWSCSWRR